jgi:EAL domain-containing protein (putative c-di-GMP-specific phosphodiesterase class I)
MNDIDPRSERRDTVLLVDDDGLALQAHARCLARCPYFIETFSRASDAVARIAHGGIQAVVSDISMPGMSGVELLRAIRIHDSDLPVVLVTGLPDVKTAAEAVELGAFRYIVKPFEPQMLRTTVERAVQICRFAQAKRSALALNGRDDAVLEGADLESTFESMLETFWVAYQPIVSVGDRRVFGYEALLRSDESRLPEPGHVLKAAERLGALARLGRSIRRRAAEPVLETDTPWTLFVNLHPQDLADPNLIDSASELAAIADRVVFELTERASLQRVENVQETVTELRKLGFRIAVDDLGTGYAGLTTFALLEPEMVKLDMSLVRGIHESPVQQRVVASMTALCRDMQLLTIAEGVETIEERDTLLSLGCDLLQGYLFARPGRPFPEPRWQ